MQDKIRNLIQSQKLAVEECREEIQGSTEDYILELEAEISLRNSFISDLEDLLSPQKGIKIEFNETEDKF